MHILYIFFRSKYNIIKYAKYTSCTIKWRVPYTFKAQRLNYSFFACYIFQCSYLKHLKWNKKYFWLTSNNFVFKFLSNYDDHIIYILYYIALLSTYTICVVGQTGGYKQALLAHNFIFLCTYIKILYDIFWVNIFFWRWVCSAYFGTIMVKHITHN